MCIMLKMGVGSLYALVYDFMCVSYPASFGNLEVFIDKFMFIVGLSICVVKMIAWFIIPTAYEIVEVNDRQILHRSITLIYC